MKIAWLAPYPVTLLTPSIVLSREGKNRHACSWVVNLSRALAKRSGVDLHLFTVTAWVPYDQVIKRDNITFHVLKNGIPLLNRGFPPWLPFDLLSGYQGDAQRLSRAIAKTAPDLVHAHGTEAAYALGGLASGYPCLISIQGIISEYQKTNPSLRNQFLSRIEQGEVRRGKYFGCRTLFDMSFVRRFNTHARIFELQEAMDPIYFEAEWKPGDGTGILFVGSLEERKGALFLIEALALVNRRVPQANLTVVGSGPAHYVSRLKNRARELGISSNVTFRGPLSPREIAAEHLKAQVYVLPTLNDNSPNTLAEAMVSGMPVVATRVGGVPSMITDGETGILVPSGDARALGESIVRLLTDPDLRTRLGSNAAGVARLRHNPERVAEQALSAYRQILDIEGKVPSAVPAVAK